MEGIHSCVSEGVAGIIGGLLCEHIAEGWGSYIMAMRRSYIFFLFVCNQYLVSFQETCHLISRVTPYCSIHKAMFYLFLTGV